MDLRNTLSPSDVSRAATVLDYQPFILADDVQTGVAYSWYRPEADERVTPPLVFRRDDWQSEWGRISDINARQRAMYDDLLDEIAARFPGGLLFDPACNNGYFMVGAELRGMRGTGIDLCDYSAGVNLLNEALGTKAKFYQQAYDSRTHRLPFLTNQQFDVTVISAIMCHLPDPLYFLAEVARVTSKAILFWGQIVETDALIVAFRPPHPSLSSLQDFPHSFNDNTRLSMGMFRESMRLTGFPNVTEIPWKPTWLPGIGEPVAWPLERELVDGSRHVALLATR